MEHLDAHGGAERRDAAAMPSSRRWVNAVEEWTDHNEGGDSDNGY